MDFQDYYETLGVPRTASAKEIRAAFRKLARQHHPDVNPGNKEAEERFKRINEAFEVLSDPEKRKKYDELGSRWREYEQWQRAGGEAEGAPFEWAASRGPGGARQEYHAFTEDDLRDLFGEGRPFSGFYETFFGGEGGYTTGSTRAGPRPRPGADVEAELRVTLAEAYRGDTRLIGIETPDGQTRRLEVRVPPGVEDGTRVRLSGQGEPGRAGGPPGDLYLTVHLLPDPDFTREGDDLRARVTVPLTTMLLGGQAVVPTPDGRRLALTIPPGAQDGRTFRLRGQGMPVAGNPGERGSLLAELHVRLPERLSERQRALIEELARLEEDALAGAGRDTNQTGER